jgi:hypothetical protein
LLTGEAKAVREWAILGVWGREVHLVDNEAKYARAPENGNFPISMWSNRWSTMPLHVPNPPPNLPKPDERAFLDRMPGTKVPVIRQPFQPGDMLPSWASTRFTGNYLYRPDHDPDEAENLAGRLLEREMADKLRQALLSIEAPDDTLVRFGLA